MSRPKLIKLLKKKHPQLKKSQLEIIIDTFFSSIENALTKKKSVELRGFGTFFTKEIKAKYTARNPKTGEKVVVDEKKSISFKMSKDLFHEINDE